MSKIFVVSILVAVLANVVSCQPKYAPQLLDLHNVLKMGLNYDNYTWSDTLYQSAQTWANKLASTNTFSFSNANGIGENIIALQTIPNTDMISYMFKIWSAEKKYFIATNRWPDCSTTGKWRDVGNYTQLVWGASTQLGCGFSVSGTRNVLVCRYTDPGLMIGNYPYLIKTKPITTTTPTTTTTTPTTTTTTTTPTTTTTTPTTTTTTTTPTKTTTTPTTTTSTNTTTGNGQPWFAAQLLDLHNVLKQSVNYHNYTWSDDLYKSAQSWADYLASSYNFYHSGTGGVGENIATATTRDTDMIAFMFSLWSAEKKYFDPTKRFPDCSTTGNWGDVAHYTQLVWNASDKVGCGVGINSGNYVLVCQYKEAGNYIGNWVYFT